MKFHFKETNSNIILSALSIKILDRNPCQILMVRIVKIKIINLILKKIYFQFQAKKIIKINKILNKNQELI